jgi:predicted TIM-barrel fold metal-dependent hydrolase
MKNKVLIYKPKDIIKANRLIGEFMGLIFVDDYSFKKTESGRIFNRGVLGYSSHWDALMPVVEKLEDLGVHIDIRPHSCHIVWWYSKNKHTTFEGNSCAVLYQYEHLNLQVFLQLASERPNENCILKHLY